MEAARKSVRAGRSDDLELEAISHAHRGISALPRPESGVAEFGDAAMSKGRLVPEEAARQLTDALADHDPIRSKARVAQVLQNLTKENVAEILAAFENAPKNDDTVDRHFRDFLYAWGRLAGEDAIAYAMDKESARRTSWGSTSAVSGWAVSDPGAAKQYVASVESADSRQWLHYGVMREIMRSDLDGAIAYSEQNVKSRARGYQMDRLAGEIVRQRGIGGLTDWVHSIDHTSEENDLLSYKQYAVGITLDKLAAENPDSALQFITENASEPFLTADGLERAARRAGGPINEELDWLSNLPSEISGRRHAIGERFEDYIREDFAAAGEWLAAQELGPAYDEAIQDYANSAARDDREAALAWAERITDPKLREETINRIRPKIRVETKFIEIEQG